MELITTNDLFNASEKRKVKVLSLDIFDTVLIRVYSKPTDVFYAIHQKLEALGYFRDWTDREHFNKLRIQAEVDARQDLLHENCEVSVVEVYTKLVEQHPFLFHDFVNIDLLVECEESVEMDGLKLNKRFLEQLKENIDYQQLIFVSDMYLSKRFLEDVLQKSGVDKVLGKHTHLYVSNEYRKGKTSGLFHQVFADLSVQPAEIIHAGDNVHADFYSPKELGIEAYYYDISAPFVNTILEEEKKIADEFRNFNFNLFKTADCGLTAIRKRAYVQNGGELVNHFNYGSTVIGPMMAGFIDWIISEARKNNITKLFSFTREAYLFNKLLKEACRQQHVNLEILEVNVSRYFLKHISIDLSSKQKLYTYFKKRTNPSIADIADEFGLDHQEIENLSENISNKKANLSDDQLKNVTQALFNSSGIIEKVKANNLQQKEYYKAYLNEIGFNDPTLYITDLGYGGTIQRLLQDFIDQEGWNSQIRGLYFFTDYRIHDLKYGSNSFSGFLGNGGQPFYLRDIFIRTPEILEQVCMPDNGSYKGFDKEGKCIYFDQGIKQEQRAEIKKMQEGVLHFNALWQSYTFDKTPRYVDFNHLIAYLQIILLRSLRNPLLEEVRLFANWFHDNNDGSDECDPFLGTQEVMNRAKGMSFEEISQLTWLECFWPNGLYVYIKEQRIETAVTPEKRPVRADMKRKIKNSVRRFKRLLKS